MRLSKTRRAREFRDAHMARLASYGSVIDHTNSIVGRPVDFTVDLVSDKIRGLQSMHRL